MLTGLMSSDLDFAFGSFCCKQFPYPAGVLALEEYFSCANLRCSKEEISGPTRKGSAFGHDTCYLYPLVQTGTEYIRIPKPNETVIVIRAYA